MEGRGIPIYTAAQRPPKASEILRGKFCTMEECVNVKMKTLNST